MSLEAFEKAAKDHDDSPAALLAELTALIETRGAESMVFGVSFADGQTWRFDWAGNLLKCLGMIRVMQHDLIEAGVDFADEDEDD